ncbi:hypothetical protein GMAR_ORF23 [Golden Marseillevirus]|uniref:hypothetical protein n=1 Tax=Golden Marseillevirus TaxID=1720526 RepID=UPI000877AB12|nr:hypothetical protein GMAR_ORF23 [Golden Marseillevirus]ALX27398.1 hypothetical protein GMAR_ORF23 [Golden Marseillevirus]
MSWKHIEIIESCFVKRLVYFGEKKKYDHFALCFTRRNPFPVSPADFSRISLKVKDCDDWILHLPTTRGRKAMASSWQTLNV